MSWSLFDWITLGYCDPVSVSLSLTIFEISMWFIPEIEDSLERWQEQRSWVLMKKQFDVSSHTLSDWNKVTPKTDRITVLEETIKKKIGVLIFRLVCCVVKVDHDCLSCHARISHVNTVGIPSEEWTDYVKLYKRSNMFERRREPSWRDHLHVGRRRPQQGWWCEFVLEVLTSELGFDFATTRGNCRSLLSMCFASIVLKERGVCVSTWQVALTVWSFHRVSYKVRHVGIVTDESRKPPLRGFFISIYRLADLETTGPSSILWLIRSVHLWWG